MRLIDADICLHKAWQNFYKQEDEHEKNIDGYDIMRDQFYEQSGFECCQQTIVNAPTVEAIPLDRVEQIRAEIESRLQGVNIILEILVKDDALIPRMEAAKTTLEEVLDIFDKALKEQSE